MQCASCSVKCSVFVCSVLCALYFARRDVCGMQCEVHTVHIVQNSVGTIHRAYREQSVQSRVG